MDRSNIQAIITKYRESKIQSEAEVRSKLIVPLLEELGYASKYRAEEFPVYGYGGREKLPAKDADFLLFDNEGFAEHRTRTKENNEWVREHSLLVVEAKKPGKIPEELGQAQYYTMWTRAVAYIETDGEEVFGYYYNPVANDRVVLQTTVDELGKAELLDLLTYESISGTKEKGIQFFGSAGNPGGRNGSSNAAYPEEGAFIVSHPLQYFGHEAEITEVLSWIGTHKIIVVYGEGGIGKTEFCREVLIQANTKYYAVNLIECRDFSQFISRIAGVMGIPVAADSAPAMIESRVLEGLRLARGILYLDNFEDVMSEVKTEKTERHRVLDFMRKCLGDVPVTVLISSRTLPQTDFDFQKHWLKPLDDSNAIALFMDIWGGDENKAIQDFVVKDLHKYPLAIILTAKQKRYVQNIDRLKELWKNARKNVRVKGMGNDRHKSVETALSITYDEIKNDENARRLWALFTLFPEAIDASSVESIIPDSYDAVRKLIDLSVVHGEGEKLEMLPLLREYVRETEEYNEDLEVLSGSLLEYYSGVFKVDRNTEMGSEKDLIAVNALGDALYFMDCMVGTNNTTAVGTLHNMLRDYYMERPYEAVEVLTKAVKHLSFDDEGINANLIKYLGDLEMRTDKLEEAEKHYVEAEGAYRRIHDDLGLANVLKAMGDLEMRTAKLEEAESHYREAEGAYRRIHYDLGLANVLKAMGEMRTDKLEEAESHYREAEGAYRRIHYDIGLANVLKAMGDLEMRTDKLEEAEKLYVEAEGVYRRIHSDLGLANVLLMRAILLEGKGQYSQAIEILNEAVSLYIKTRDNVGLTYTYSELCYCYAEEGNEEKVLTYAKQMVELCESLPYEYVKGYCASRVKSAFKKLGLINDN